MVSYTFLENIETEVPIPENGILSRTLFNDQALKVVAFGFSAGQELSVHTAPMAAVLYFVKGEAERWVPRRKMSAQEPSSICRRKRPAAFWPRFQWQCSS